MKRSAVHVVVAIGFTLLLAGAVASIITGDWTWLVIGVACLLAGAIWSNVERHPS